MKLKWKNVLCVYPYHYRNPYYVFPPLALEYIAGSIKDFVEKVTVVDMRFERDVKPYMKDVDLVCTYGHYEDCAIFGQLREDCLKEIEEATPEGVPLIAGGSNAIDIKRTFEKCPKLNIIIRGNPEYPVREFIRKGSPEGITNLVYRGQDGNLVFNESKTLPISNDIIPAKNLRKYRYEAYGLECDLMRTSIGCNYKCRFCYQYGKGSDSKFMKWQGRTAESIFKELKLSDATFVALMDDDLLVDMDRIDKLCDMIIQAKMKKIFAGTSRTNYIIGREKTLKKMEKAGFLGISYGVESPYERTLKFYKKGVSEKMNAEGLRLMNRTNILVSASFVLGSPGETGKDILNYLKYCHKHNVDSAVTNRLRVPKGTELYEELYDPATGKPREDEKYKRVEGRELEQIKYAVKYGQRTPLRILLIIMKLSRHKGMPVDPFYIFMSVINTVTKGTSLQRIAPFRWLIKFLMFIFRSTPWRLFNKFMATIFYRPIRIINWVWEKIDDALGISITLLPKIFNLFYQKTYMKQKLEHGWKQN